MSVDDIVLLQQIAEAQSFAAVARLRDTDPSLISRQVARIEEGLGIRVFQRSTRALSVSEAGAAYLARIDTIPGQIEEARQFALGAASRIEGTLRVTASHAFTQLKLVPLLPKLRASHPLLRLNLAVSDANLDLHAEGIDLAFRLGPEVSGDHVVSRLKDVTYRIVASKDWCTRNEVKAPADLTKVQVLSFALPGFRSHWLFTDGAGRETEVAVTPLLETSSALVLRQLALDGVGPSLLADWCIDADIDAGTLIDLFADHAVSVGSATPAVWIVYPSRSHLPLKTRAAIDFFRHHL